MQWSVVTDWRGVGETYEGRQVVVSCTGIPWPVGEQQAGCQLVHVASLADRSGRVSTCKHHAFPGHLIPRQLQASPLHRLITQGSETLLLEKVFGFSRTHQEHTLPLGHGSDVDLNLVCAVLGAVLLRELGSCGMQHLRWYLTVSTTQPNFHLETRFTPRTQTQHHQTISVSIT